MDPSSALPRYPVYIPTKGRAKICTTPKFLVEDGVPFRMVVEPQEHAEYAAIFGAERLLTLPFSDRGHCEARNWIKAHAKAEGHHRHWQLDDNIISIMQMVKGKRKRCPSGWAFSKCEDLVDRYTNVAVIGLKHQAFIDDVPLILNRQTYSCFCVLSDLDVNWRHIPADPDFALQLLKAGWCTMLVQAFVMQKVRSEKMPGGCTPYYVGNGRLLNAQWMRSTWPGLVTIARKHGVPKARIHPRIWRSFPQRPIKKAP
jgi:TET-associated glycosyltransferase-like protein